MDYINFKIEQDNIIFDKIINNNINIFEDIINDLNNLVKKYELAKENINKQMERY